MAPKCLAFDYNVVYKTKLVGLLYTLYSKLIFFSNFIENDLLVDQIKNNHFTITRFSQVISFNQQNEYNFNIYFK